MPVGRRVGQRFSALAMPQGRRIASYYRFEFEGVFFVDLAKGQQVAALAEICGTSRGGNNQTAKPNKPACLTPPTTKSDSQAK